MRCCAAGTGDRTGSRSGQGRAAVGARDRVRPRRTGDAEAHTRRLPRLPTRRCTPRSSVRSVGRKSIGWPSSTLLVAAAGRSAARQGHRYRLHLRRLGSRARRRGRRPRSAPLRPTPLVAWRPEHEQAVLAASSDGVRTAVIRPAVVYGGARGIVADLLKDAQNGLVRVVGDGQNQWPCVYDRDLADLYVRVATNPEASGIFHANDEADERVDDIVAGDRATRQDAARRAVHAARGSARQDGPLCGCAGAQSDRPQSARKGAGLGADAPLRVRQRGAPARGVPHVSRSGVASSSAGTPEYGTPQPCTFSRRS